MLVEANELFLKVEMLVKANELFLRQKYTFLGWFLEYFLLVRFVTP
jgi:hypothetical protein